MVLNQSSEHVVGCAFLDAASACHDTSYCKETMEDALLALKEALLEGEWPEDFVEDVVEVLRGLRPRGM